MHTLKGSSRAERTIIFIIFLDHILGFSYLHAGALATSNRYKKSFNTALLIVIVK